VLTGAKMFYQAYTIRRSPKSPPGSDGMVLSAAECRYLQRAHSIPSLPGVIEVRTAHF